MANNKSQGQFASWNQHEDTVTNEFSIAFDNNIDLQENLQHEVHSENLPDSFPAQDTQPLGMWAPETETGPCKFVGHRTQPDFTGPRNIH